MRPNYDVVCVALHPAGSLPCRAVLLAGAIILLSGCGQPTVATNPEVAQTTTPVSEQHMVFTATTTDAGPLSVEN
jgi:type IV pilus biogenesis protein CpaD/CtpE